MRKLLDAIRMRRIKSYYRAIAKLEVKVSDQAGPWRLKSDFLAESFESIDHGQKQRGMRRQQRRQFRRRIVNARW